MHYQQSRHEFYDADNPQYPMILPSPSPSPHGGRPLVEVERTEAYTDPLLPWGVGQTAVVFRHFVRITW